MPRLGLAGSRPVVCDAKLELMHRGVESRANFEHRPGATHTSGRLLTVGRSLATAATGQVRTDAVGACACCIEKPGPSPPGRTTKRPAPIAQLLLKTRVAQELHAKEI